MAFVFALLLPARAELQRRLPARRTSTRPTASGVAILVCVLARGRRASSSRAARSRAGERGGWRLGARARRSARRSRSWCCRSIEYFNLAFETAGGGFASVFLGWTLLFALFWLGAVYWVETLVAQSSRPPTPPTGSASVLRPERRRPARVYLYTLAAIEILGLRPPVPGQVMLAVACSPIAERQRRDRGACSRSSLPLVFVIIVLAVWWVVAAARAARRGD